MSAQLLKQAVVGGGTNTAVAKQRPNTIAGLLTDPVVKAQISLALPKHMTADRLARIALTEVRKNPKLGNADQASFLGAIMQCAQLGLERFNALFCVAVFAVLQRPGMRLLPGHGGDAGCQRRSLGLRRRGLLPRKHKLALHHP